MPSPLSPHSSSLSSNRSSRSANVPGTDWPKKFSNFITRNKNSSLTRQNLEEFNKRNAIVHDERYSTTSPYYKGLTDFSLVIDREGLPVLNPERESNAAISVSSSSSSRFTRFFFRNNEEKRASSSSSMSMLSRTLAATMARANDREKKDTSGSMESHTTNSLEKGKPLRESASDAQPTASPPPSPPQASQLPPPPRLQTSPVKRVVASSEETAPEAQSSPPPPPPSPLLPLTAAQTLSTKRFVSTPNERVSKAQLTPPSPPPTPPTSPLPSLPPTQASLVERALSSSKDSESTRQLTPPLTQPPLQTSLVLQTSPSKRVLWSSKLIAPHAQSSPPHCPPSPLLTAAQTLPTTRFVSSPNERVSTPSSPPPTLPSPPLPSLTPTQTSRAQRAVSSLKESESKGKSTPPTPQSPSQTSILPKLTEAQTSPDKKFELILKGTNKTENEKKYIWADRYRPDALNDFICNRDKAIELKALVTAEDRRHFIFEGRPGVGKRTMICALLREAFGADKIQAREECKEFQLKGEAANSILVNVKESSQHVELRLSELKGYEKQIIVVLIKEINNKPSNKSSRCDRENCRAIVLYEADKLSKDALLYIRWLLGRYEGCHKFFFCCNDVSKLKPIKSLCNIVQLLPPSDEETLDVLEFIAKQEGIDLPRQLAEKFAKNSKNNLRQAIRSFEATWRSSSPLKEDQVIMTGWEDDIAIIAKNMVEDQSPKQLYLIHGKFQTLIAENVSPEFIFKTLVGELKTHLDEESQIRTDKLYEEYNRDDDRDKQFAFKHNRDKKMSKKNNDPVKENIHHFMKIEEFIAKFMSCHQASVGSNKGVSHDDAFQGTS